ncbi:MAG: hypothetical protein HOO67_05910 [Candidatus Peribacteraceae bacterium]|nr:hypothetical protein [Candidatus Peribacteraceae bacterium]
MKRMLQLLVTLIVVALALGVGRTVMVQWSGTQKEFLTGSLPSPMPDGFHKGSTAFYQGSWRGKTFNTKTNTGINMMGDPPVPAYPFRTYVTKGLRDTALDVLRIDYDSPENSWYVRRVVDEIVQIAPGKYLGKIHLRVIPGFPFIVGFFRLEK